MIGVESVTVLEMPMPAVAVESQRFEVSLVAALAVAYILA